MYFFIFSQLYISRLLCSPFPYIFCYFFRQSLLLFCGLLLLRRVLTRKIFSQTKICQDLLFLPADKLPYYIHNILYFPDKLKIRLLPHQDIKEQMPPLFFLKFHVRIGRMRLWGLLDQENLSE